MAKYQARVAWRATGPDFLRGKYSRAHTWAFDGGVLTPASASPQVVPAPWSDPAGVDPEEAFVAAIASCHMLTFLWRASRSGFVVESYEDDAEGVMTPNDRGVPWVSHVTLRPRILYGAGRAPTAEQEARLHDEAHGQCYIAASVKTEITVAAPAGDTPPADPLTSG